MASARDDRIARNLSAIRDWQEDATTEIGSRDHGVIARLLQGCLELFSSLLTNPAASSSLSKRIANSLQRSYDTLRLWADGHGVLDGTLDHLLERSKRLQYTTLATLNSVCGVLLNRLSRIILVDSEDARISLLHELNVHALYEQTKFIIAGLDEVSSNSDSDSDTSADEVSKGEIESIAEDIKSYTQCLVDLSSALECPALDPDPCEDETSIPRLEKRGAYDYYADLITAKYPKASLNLVKALGKANWDRYQRMQQERSINANSHEEAVVSKSYLADSEFRDSGLGTSIPVQQSTYAETIISFMSSIAGGLRIQIPPLPAEGKAGEKFECIACGKYIRAITNREWRKHLYQDLRPYTCFHPNCSFDSSAFPNRQVWSSHLELDHRLGPNWEAESCPLCFESTGAGKSVILVHYARHMEDIALAALPRNIESEANSDDESQTTSENKSTPQVLEAATPEVQHSSWILIESAIKSEDHLLKSVTFELTPPAPQEKRPGPLDMTIGPFDTVDTIYTTIEEFYGLDRGDFTLQDQYGILHPTFENLVDGMTVTVRSYAGEVDEAGRKRQPPLAPGHSLRFVVASHPDDFKADETTRNIRSHVMYKLRGEQRGGSKSPRDRSMSGVLGQQSASSVASDSKFSNGEERRYCFCNEVSYGDMVACDYGACPKEWFHLACVNMEKVPKGQTKWFCSNECREAHARAIHGSPALDGTIVEMEQSTIKCFCGFSDDDGNTVLCEKCDTWQHIVCYYESAHHVPDIHECTDCQPRSVDRKSAAEKQRLRRSQTGCFTCRLRRKKCDGEKPSCRACKQHVGLHCEYKRPVWWSNNEQRRYHKEIIKNSTKRTKLTEKTVGVANGHHRARSPSPLSRSPTRSNRPVEKGPSHAASSASPPTFRRSTTCKSSSPVRGEECGLRENQYRHPCTYCKRYRGSNGFKRMDDLKQHLREYHHIEDDEDAHPDYKGTPPQSDSERGYAL